MTPSRAELHHLGSPMNSARLFAAAAGGSSSGGGGQDTARSTGGALATSRSASSGGILTARSGGSLTARSHGGALNTSRSSLGSSYERHRGDFAVWPRGLGNSFFLAEARKACSNDWVYTRDLAQAKLDAENAAIAKAEADRLAAIAEAQWQRDRARLGKLAEPAVANAELEIMAWLISSHITTAKQELDMERVEKHKRAAAEKRAKEEARQQDEQNRANARDAMAKAREKAKRDKEAKAKAKAEREKREAAAMKAQFGF